MAFGRLTLPYQSIPKPPIVLSAPADCSGSVAGLPDFLATYDQAASWTALCVADILDSGRSLPDKHIYLKSINIQQQDPNIIFGQVRTRLSAQHYFAFTLVTSENIKVRLKAKVNTLLFNTYYPVYFVLKRVLPKLGGFRWLYRRLNIRPDISKAEIMGRLIYKGFVLIDIIEDPRQTTIIARHNNTADPSLTKPSPSQGFLLRMERLGQHARPIIVYKLRTMHPYAEYVQAYIHQTHGLDQNGKFRNDFRVITGGRVIRRYWIDEIPMLYNLLRGDIKLIGIRPISSHYFHLYPADAQLIRSRHKPGLLPPFYADLPQTFDEIVQSELTYLTAYEKAPSQTDLRYFGRIVANILFKKARSK